MLMLVPLAQEQKTSIPKIPQRRSKTTILVKDYIFKHVSKKGWRAHERKPGGLSPYFLLLGQLGIPWFKPPPDYVVNHMSAY